MNLTGDPFIFQTIGKSFARGNFPIYEPWQPDMKFSYHYGPSIFLAVFHQIANLPFDLVQRVTSFVIALMMSQFLIWIFKRHFSLKSLLVYQLIPLISLISLGNWMMAIPIFPFKFPPLPNGLFSWLSALPTSHVSFSTYGGAINDLNGLIYFYHELIGMMAFIWILWLSFTYNKNFRNLSFFFLTISIAATAIINEVFLPLSILASSLIIFFREFPFKNFFSFKRILLMISLAFLLVLLVVFQGGTPTESIFGFKSEYPTAQILPNKKNIFVLIDKDLSLQNYQKEIINLADYQKIQQSSKLFSPESMWYPFRWFHPGFIYFYIANFIACFIFYLFKQKNRLLLSVTLLVSAIIATLIYNSTYVIANNSSRLIAFTYTFLGTNLAFFVVWVLEYLANKRVYFILASIIVAWLSIPSFLPPLSQQLTPAEPQNKLFFQERETLPPVLDWVYRNLPYNARVFNLVSAGYNGYTLAKLGVFTPTWPPGIRAYTMDSSPAHLDATFTLNPSPLKQLKITHLIIDSYFFSKLPKARQEALNRSDYFQIVFSADSFSTNSWERVYQIKDNYFTGAQDLPGTFKQLDQEVIPLKAKVYIDKTTPLSTTKDLGSWYPLRRALIFALRNRELYYDEGIPNGTNLPYQHVEAKVSGSPPSKSVVYDYLTLFSDTIPETVCDCKTEVLWKGFEDNIVIWRVLK